MSATLPAGELPAASKGAQNIVASIRREILEGRYTFGERLPAERMLAQHFTAARGTVREALRQLEQMRLVRRRAGSGTYVAFREPSESDGVAQSTSPLELIEVRRGIEPHMVRLAILHASAHDVSRLGNALRDVEHAGTDPEQFSRADEAFHLALAECSQNPLMIWLYRHINDVRGQTQWSARKDRILQPQRIAEYNAQHFAIYRSVEIRDMDTALATITGHLDKARADLMGMESPRRRA